MCSCYAQLGLATTYRVAGSVTVLDGFKARFNKKEKSCGFNAHLVLRAEHQLRHRAQAVQSHTYHHIEDWMGSIVMKSVKKPMENDLLIVGRSNNHPR